MIKYAVSFSIGVSLTLLGFGYYYGELKVAFIVLIVALSIVALAAALIYRFLWEHDALTVVTWLCGAGVMFFGIICLSEHREIIALSLMSLLYLGMMTFYSLTYPNLQQNGTTGIKTHYALEYKEVWERTHIFYSVINTAFLPMILFTALHGGYIFKMLFSQVVLLTPMLIAAYYSHIVGKRYEKEAEREVLEERKREIENGWRGPNLKGK